MGESVTLEGYEVLQTWSILEDGSSADPIVNDRKLGYDSTEGERKKMKRQQYMLSIFTNLIIMSLVLTGCAGSGGEEDRVVYISNETGVEAPLVIPAEYKDKINPLAGDPAAIASGKEAYFALCSQCHGEDGRGEGPDAAGLNPRPADFTDQEQMQENTDGYLLWRISDGGDFDPYNSLMTAWGTLLSEQEIWELISYLRTLP
jgi:mono/diheme cytochrome c family protein